MKIFSQQTFIPLSCLFLIIACSDNSSSTSSSAADSTYRSIDCRAWDAVTHPHFERDFLPEIQHQSALTSEPVESLYGKSLRWSATENTKIELTRKDLNIAISAIDINLAPLDRGVAVTIVVTYEKAFKRKFVKAHLAVRGLFRQKLSVLKADFTPLANEFAYR